MADFTADALSDRGACFLRHHGLLAIGATIERAFKAAAVTEASADVYLRARQFGDVPELPGPRSRGSPTCGDGSGPRARPRRRLS